MWLARIMVIRMVGVPVARFLLNADIEKIARYLGILAELHKHGDVVLSLESLEAKGYPCQILTRMSGWGLLNRYTSSVQGVTYEVNTKAIEENKKGKRVVLVFPSDKWIHMMLEAGATVRNLKDVRWCATEDGTEGPGTGRWVAMFILESKEVK